MSRQLVKKKLQFYLIRLKRFIIYSYIYLHVHRAGAVVTVFLPSPLLLLKYVRIYVSINTHKRVELKDFFGDGTHQCTQFWPSAFYEQHTEKWIDTFN